MLRKSDLELRSLNFEPEIGWIWFLVCTHIFGIQNCESWFHFKIPSGLKVVQIQSWVFFLFWSISRGHFQVMFQGDSRVDSVELWNETWSERVAFMINGRQVFGWKKLTWLYDHVLHHVIPLLLSCKQISWWWSTPSLFLSRKDSDHSSNPLLWLWSLI